MGHYDRPVHTCDEDEHNWSKRITDYSIKIVFRSGEPCLKLWWKVGYHCTNEGEKHMRQAENRMMKCEKTKLGDNNKTYIPIREL